MKQEGVSQEEIVKRVEKILEERGSKAYEKMKNEILQEKIECDELYKALNYFMSRRCAAFLIRPALISICCEAVGGDPNLTTSIATSLTLMCGGMDIHDDIIDRSKIKASHQTILGKFGEEMALLAGDALLFKGLTLTYEILKEGVSAKKVAAIMDIVRRIFFELGDAEALELSFRGRMDVTPEDYLHVMRKKSADVEAYTRIGAILGGGSKGEIEALGRYGRLLGMIMRLNDDLIDTFDFEECLHRIKKECLPLPILYALQNPEIKPTIESILLKKTMTKRDAERLLEITYEAGGLKHLEYLMRESASKACSELEKLKYNKKQLELLAKAMLPPPL